MFCCLNHSLGGYIKAALGSANIRSVDHGGYTTASTTTTTTTTTTITSIVKGGLKSKSKQVIWE